MAVAVSAKTILELLRARHSSDVFVPECKDGPTHYANHLRMDAWVMPRSWAKPECIGYEIKVRRSDFLQDDKWRSYLPLCNSFFFVCPFGVIQPEELPKEAGLLVVSKTGTKLYTKKKAPMRDVQIPEEVFRYVLMCRAKIEAEYRPESQEQYWQSWAAQKREKQDLGHYVSRRLSELATEKIYRVETENIKLKAENAAYAELKKILEDAGIDSWSRWDTKLELQRAIQRKLLDVVPTDFAASLETLSTAIEKVQAEWSALEREGS